MPKSKIVGKRQLQRRAVLLRRKMVNVPIVPVITTQLTSANNVVVSSSNVEYMCGADDTNNQIGSYVEHTKNTSSLPDIDDSYDNIPGHSNSTDESTDNLIDKLRIWCLEENITHSAVNNLLKILQRLHPELPLSARTLLQTPRSTETKQLLNGELLYIGILRNISKLLESCKYKQFDTIRMSVNIDGIPLFRSSDVEFWPILGMCRSIIGSSPFAIAIFCGTGKPHSLKDFLEDFINEVEFLQNHGILYNKKKINFKIEYYVCDAPARSYLKMIAGHNSKEGCERCSSLATWKDHRMIYSPDIGSARTDEDFDSDPPETSHIKGISPLHKIGTKMISQFPLDPMHLIYLGVVRRHLEFLIFGKRPYKLSANTISILENRIASIKQYIPSEFNRKPRPIKLFKRWKATELRLFCLYTGPVLLYNLLTTEQYQHFLKLHYSVFSLSTKSTNLGNVQNILDTYVRDCRGLFDETFIVYNIHSLPHIVDDVAKFGRLDTFSCFPFENFLGILKNSVRSNNKPLQQIHRRIMEADHLSMVHSNEVRVIGKSSEQYSDTFELQYFECQKLCLKSYCLSVNEPDNCIFVNNQVYVIILIFNRNGCYHLKIVPYRYQYDMYKVPNRSSELGIIYVERLSVYTEKVITLESIGYKCVKMPHKDGFAVFPLVHLL
uniref:Transposase domain-containing protein n=1 Tax=Photinus pyralis TaxID=7054 RepID=A0A1Y1KH95_PHOPY